MISAAGLVVVKVEVVVVVVVRGGALDYWVWWWLRWTAVNVRQAVALVLGGDKDCD